MLSNFERQTDGHTDRYFGSMFGQLCRRRANIGSTLSYFYPIRRIVAEGCFLLETSLTENAD